MRNILFILVLFIFSCNSADYINDVIEQAESIVSENPDSSITILQNIHKSEELTDSLKAKYWLVTGQAHYNSQKSMAEDALIAYSMDYYGRPPNKNIYRLLQAYKLYAQYHWWSSRSEEAIVLSMEKR